MCHFLNISESVRRRIFLLQWFSAQHSITKVWHAAKCKVLCVFLSLSLYAPLLRLRLVHIKGNFNVHQPILRPRSIRLVDRIQLEDKCWSWGEWWAAYCPVVITAHCCSSPLWWGWSLTITSRISPEHRKVGLYHYYVLPRKVDHVFDEIWNDCQGVKSCTGKGLVYDFGKVCALTCFLAERLMRRIITLIYIRYDIVAALYPSLA